jgi:uncharacterized protein YecA (UPF0149 family)
MTPEEALRRANQARQVFEQPIVKDTLDFMEREIMEQWKACPVRDLEAREALWRLAVTTSKFRELLRGTMESGKLAANQIQRKQSMLEKAKSAVNQFRS